MIYFRALIPLLLLISAYGISAAPVVVDQSAPVPSTVELISETASEVVLELRVGTINVDSVTDAGHSWISLAVNGLEAASVSGLPELPQRSVWIKLPAGIPDLEILEDQTARYRWGTVRPAAEVINRADDGELRRRPDREYYARGDLYPEAPVRISVNGNIGALHLLLVTFNPVQYRARTQECIVHTRLRIRLSVRDGNSLDQIAGLPQQVDDLAVPVILNQHHDDSPDTSSALRMLVVTTPELVTALEPWIEWKWQSGVPVRTIIYSEIANDAAALQSYIRNLADSLQQSPRYLLIVGDVDAIPAFYGVDNSLTDHPYSLLTDGDYLPDLSVGRIPCHSAADCRNWVDRVLEYERDGVIGSFNGTVSSSSAGRDPQHGVFVGNLFQAAGMTVDRLQQPTTSQLPLLMNSLNNTPQWIFYIGHGYPQAWSSLQPNFTNANVDQLSMEASPIIVAVACATADLDYPGFSIAEYWLARQDGNTPLAYFGATESTAFFRSDTIGIGALRAIFQRGCERLGPAADLGRLECAQSFPQGPGGLTEETIQQFELLGDPSMRVYSRVPEVLDITFPSVLPLGENDVTISVSKAGLPVAHADICISSVDTTFYRLCETDTNGIAQFTANLTNQAVFQLVVTALNAVAFRGEITVVTQGAAYLQIGAVRVLDDTGDQDGNADRGETGALQLSVVNRGQAVSDPGIIQLTTDNRDLSLTLSEVALPAIPGRDTVWLPDSFPFTVSDDAVDQAVAMLHSTILLNTADTSRSVIPLTLHAPQIAYQGATVDVDSNNGNSTYLTLSLSFVNNGSDRAVAPMCSLISLPSGCEIVADQQIESIIEPHAAATVAFHIHALQPLPRGFPLEFSYRLSGDNLTAIIGHDVQRVGRIPVYLYVLDAMPQQVDAVAAALTSLGVEYERGMILPQDLLRYSSVWIFCGIFPNAVPLNQSEAEQLAAYLDSGGNCYWEGGDVWVFDERNALHPHFSIQGLNDGTSNAGPINGEYGSVLQDLRFDYSGENSFIDQLSAEGSAEVLLRSVRSSANYAVCIRTAGAAYRTVGSSVELGMLDDSEYPSTRVRLFREVLTGFGIECRADSYPPVVVHQPLEVFHSAVTPIAIWADIQDASGIESAVVEYRVGEGVLQSVPLTLADGLYQGQIGGAYFGSTIHYRIQAVDNSPLHNAATTDEYSLPIVAEPTISVYIAFNHMLSRQLEPGIVADPECSWSVTEYAGTPMLELHGTSDGNISYSSAVFDCSRLKSASLAFRSYVRDAGGTGALARVIGSTDGGRTYSHLVWEVDRHGGTLQEGTIVVPDLSWAAGQSQVAMRFEFFGDWYWRIGDITVYGETYPRTIPVNDLVIRPIEKGLRLAWNEIPGALYYELLTASEYRTDSAWELLTKVYDTTYTDNDLSQNLRYYIARAVMEESIQPDKYNYLTATPFTSATIRLPDLRWNRKLANSSFR